MKEYNNYPFQLLLPKEKKKTDTNFYLNDIFSTFASFSREWTKTFELSIQF